MSDRPLGDVCADYARAVDGPARDAFREELRARIAVEPYPLGGPHSMLWHEAPMYCGTCGHITQSCDCTPETLRCWKCLECGLRVMTGGPSLLDMLCDREPVS